MSSTFFNFFNFFCLATRVATLQKTWLFRKNVSVFSWAETYISIIRKQCQREISHFRSFFHSFSRADFRFPPYSLEFQRHRKFAGRLYFCAAEKAHYPCAPHLLKAYDCIGSRPAFPSFVVFTNIRANSQQSVLLARLDKHGPFHESTRKICKAARQKKRRT